MLNRFHGQNSIEIVMVLFYVTKSGFMDERKGHVTAVGLLESKYFQEQRMFEIYSIKERSV